MAELIGGPWGAVEGGDTHGRMAQLLLSLGIQYITAAKKYIVFTSQVTCKLKPSEGNNPSEQWILKILTWSLLKPKGPDFLVKKTSTQHIIQFTNLGHHGVLNCCSQIKYSSHSDS